MGSMGSKPRPKFPYSEPRLPGGKQRMTLIGAINCAGGIVLLADRQETITDYAKWDCCKITQFEHRDEYRFFMCGAGDSDPLEMVHERVNRHWREENHSGYNSIRELVTRAFREVVDEIGLPYANMDIIWAIQNIPKEIPASHLGFDFQIDLFRTSGHTVNSIPRHYFAGNPVLLCKYLSDMYLERSIQGPDEAEALAAYFLWEAKEYDPTVGKHSDIVTLLPGGGVRRMSRATEEYWEKHFYELKRAMGLLPLMSCATSSQEFIHNPQDYMERFNATLEVLRQEQKKMRANPPSDHPLTLKVEEARKEIAKKYMRIRAEKTPFTLSDSQTSEDQ